MFQVQRNNNDIVTKIIMPPNSNPDVELIHLLINTKHTGRFSFIFSLQIHLFFKVSVLSDIVGGQ